ncbi:MAG: hypothetical protein IJF03_00015 [Lachnospiraceae bacterium]|nr:hypothetical protein [Lachnospiraceae bacterium]
MENNTLSNSLRNALSYESEYNTALSAYRNAVVQVNLRKDALNITAADRIKTMIPEVAITAIFWIGTSIKPGGTIWFILSCIGMCVLAYAAYVFFAKSKKRYLKTEEYKKKKEAVGNAEVVALKKNDEAYAILENMRNKVPFLAAQYVYPETLRTLLEYLETGRAETVEDMLNLYEQDVKHQQVLEAQQRIEQEIQCLRDEVASIYIPTTYY